MARIFPLLLILASSFYIPLIYGLKCLECSSPECIKGDVLPVSKICQDRKYCYKMSQEENNINVTRRDCIDKDFLLSTELPLNECGLLDISDKKIRGPMCICSNDECNSGDNFDETPSTDIAMDCQNCKDDTKCLNGESSIIQKCKEGYICYKLFEAEENTSPIIQRGCIHSTYSSNLQLKLNTCNVFKYSTTGEDHTICICDDDNCNAGGITTTTTITTTTKATSCLNITSSSTTTFVNQILIIFILGFY